MLRDHAAWLWMLALLALTAAVYWRALGYWFAVEDDRLYVTHNPLLTSWHLRHLWTIWQAEISMNFAPLTLLSYSLDYHAWGMDPFGYHLTNLCWHLFNGVGVYALLRAMRLGSWGAWSGALWFALHPVQVESVVWIAERKNLLATAGTLVSVWSFLRATSEATPQRRRAWWRALWFLAGVGAMLAKASAVMIPVLCVLLARARDRRAWRASVRDAWPLWLCGFLVGIMHLQMQRGEIGMAGWRSGSWDGALGVLLRVWAFYLQLLVRPGMLSMHHPIDPSVPSVGWQDPRVWQSAGVLLVVAASLWWWARHRPQTGVWIGWCVLTLAPMASFVFIGVHDRYLYLPMVGIAGVLGVMVDAMRPRWRWMPVAGLTLLAAWLACGAWRRVAVWRDPQTLYADALRHAPALDTPRIILAEVEREAGHHAEAVALYRSLAEMTPAHWNGWLMRGWARARLGDTDGARTAFAQARRVAPQQPLVDRFEGEMAATHGRWQEMVQAYGGVVARQPDADAYDRLAATAEALQQWSGAARWYQRVVAIAPWHVRARRGLARCQRAMGAAPSQVARTVALAEYWERAWSDLQAAHRRMSDRYRARGLWDAADRAAREAQDIAEMILVERTPPS